MWSERNVIRESSFADDGQYRWLLRVFENFHQTLKLYETNTVPQLTILLVLDLLSLHLHASIDHMELLAGKEGIEEAQVSYTILKRWVESREARQSIWHAAQILKWIGALPSEVITDFHSVMVYHVSLCLWTYGTIMDKKGNDVSEIFGSEAQQVILNADENLASQRWIAFNKGYPVLSRFTKGTDSQPAHNLSLFSTRELMQESMQLIRNKYPARDVLPPATENICRVMDALGSVAKESFHD